MNLHKLIFTENACYKAVNVHCHIKFGHVQVEKTVAAGTHNKCKYGIYQIYNRAFNLRLKFDFAHKQHDKSACYKCV